MNRKPDQWGSFFYKQEDDVLRFKSKPQKAEFREWLEFTAQPEGDNALTGSRRVLQPRIRRGEHTRQSYASVRIQRSVVNRCRSSKCHHHREVTPNRGTVIPRSTRGFTSTCAL